jgi:hypothetical protein
MTINRRDALKYLSLIVGQAYLLPAKSVFAQADDGYYFLNFQFPGAPNAYMYHSFLNPHNSADFVPNGFVGTAFVKDGDNRYTNVRHDLIQVGGLHLPPLWGFDLPAPGSATRSAASILQHMINILGVEMPADGHPFCQAQHFLPLGSKRSITALTPDQYPGAPFATLDYASEYHEFRTTTSAVPVDVPGKTNPVKELMSPFAAPAYSTQLTQYSTQTQSFESAMQSFVEANFPESALLYEAEASAKALAARQFPNYDTFWNEAYARYKDLISRTLASTFPGINDFPVGSLSTAGRTEIYRLNEVMVNMADLRGLIVAGTNIDNMAKQFAVAEFAMQFRLTRSYTAGVGAIAGLAASAAPHDSHFTGKIPDLLINTLYWASFHSCLMELIAKIEGFGIWPKTLIRVGGEFNRTPKGSGIGSDHGFRAANVVFYSGRNSSGPLLIGDTVNQSRFLSSRTNYPGTYGEAAPITSLGGRPVGIGDVTSTMARLLGVPNPVSTTASLIDISAGGEITSLIGAHQLKRQA